MCAADMTLEPLRLPQKGKIAGVHGWGVKHVCRHWDEVRMWDGREEGHWAERHQLMKLCCRKGLRVWLFKTVICSCYGDPSGKSVTMR